MLTSCTKEAPPGFKNSERFLANVTTLSADAFGGRAPMSEGEHLTLDFLETAFREAGLEPLFGDAYRQPVQLVSMEANAETIRMSFERSGGLWEPLYAQDFVAWTQRVEPTVEITESEIVFVGYGVVAPEYDWNDYAGVDMTGKTALILINDPGFALQDPAVFKGNAMTYYGRWRYKFEEAARQGAAAAIIIHDTEPAAYGWNTVRNSWTGPQFYLPSAPGGSRPVVMESWLHKDAAGVLLNEAGFELEALQQRALSPAFAPIALGTRFSAHLDSDIVTGTSHNIGGMVRGSEAPDEAVIYTAHWDHIGTGQSEDPSEDVIYNGAVDNATGIAALIELAHAFTTMAEPPRRSVAFLAVTAEESGLLGSAWYAEHPAFPMKQTVAGINIDAMSVYGPTRDVVVVGYGSSELEDILRRAADSQGRTVEPEPHPERGGYYRSDHFNFAKRGVPMLYAESGTDHRELGSEYMEAKAQEYVELRYHQPADEVGDDWDLRGAMEDIELYYRIGFEIADGDSWPRWYDGHEFKAIREATMREDRTGSG